MVSSQTLLAIWNCFVLHNVLGSNRTMVHQLACHSDLNSELHWRLLSFGSLLQSQGVIRREWPISAVLERGHCLYNINNIIHITNSSQMLPSIQTWISPRPPTRKIRASSRNPSRRRSTLAMWCSTAMQSTKSSWSDRYGSLRASATITSKPYSRGGGKNGQIN